MPDSFDAEMERLTDLDTAVRQYLSHLWSAEQGADDDDTSVEYWRGQMQDLTGETW